MHHHREGSGPPLVLIHGVGHHWQAWRPVIDHLAGSFDVVATDSPGFGRSAPLPKEVEPTVWAYTDAFEKFIRDQKLDRPHVAGNSMGGAIALELARRGVVHSATALSPAGFYTPRELRYAQLSLSLISAIPAPMRPAVQALARTRPGRIVLFSQLVARPMAMPGHEAAVTLRDVWASPVFKQALKALDQYEFTAGNELDQTSVTVAWGDKDRLLLHRRQSQRARTALPEARHVTLDAGHVPFHDASEAVAAVIRSTTES